MTSTGTTGHGLEFLEAPARPSAAADAAQRFREAFGAEPAGVWSAPGRVNLIGEHVDYTGGLALPLALPHRTFVALAPRTDGTVRVRSAQEASGWDGSLADVGPGRPDGWAAYVAGVPWAMAQVDGAPFSGADVLSGGFDVLVDGHVPLGSGLSSSAALECAVAVALADLAGVDLRDPRASDAVRARLAEACVRAENDVAGAPTGGMDQAASLRCHEGAGILLDCRDGTVRHVPLDLAAAGLALLVVDTRASHSHSGGEYGQRRASLEAACAALGVPDMRAVDPAGLDAALAELPDDVTRARVRHAVTEIDRVRRAAALLAEGREREIAGLLDASHESLRHDYEVSSVELDLVVDTARSAGALGARMTGGGFGGSAIALVEIDAVRSVAAEIGIAFAAQGLRAPQFLPALPSAGAARDL
ncbi:galactokinase [Kineococcus xinjiangensis]|uniref:Galactokinase n=1 Tax=Kineococcus xinjiangensis TaxID=512762 RepID=A0A2S6ITT5_9ACTN|nr:galactokinase [Kineococcus xinjiangensis]PPK97659.1 galactokinase [Kineococcus xinjiangensis]